MLKWINSNKNALIRNSFLLPILLVVIMSISHVVSWYDLGNPISWAIYLSVAIEIFALASVSAASIKIKKGSIWLLFGLVTLIQIVGNIFFTYKDIDATGQSFLTWVELIEFWFEDWDITDHKRFLAYIQGGTLPFMSLIALHFYIKFNENLDEKETDQDLDTEKYFEARNKKVEEIVNARKDNDESPSKETDEYWEDLVEKLNQEDSQESNEQKPLYDTGDLLDKNKKSNTTDDSSRYITKKAKDRRIAKGDNRPQKNWGK